MAAWKTPCLTLHTQFCIVIHWPRSITAPSPYSNMPLQWHSCQTGCSAEPHIYYSHIPACHRKWGNTLWCTYICLCWSFRLCIRPSVSVCLSLSLCLSLAACCLYFCLHTNSFPNRTRCIAGHCTSIESWSMSSCDRNGRCRHQHRQWNTRLPDPRHWSIWQSTEVQDSLPNSHLWVELLPLQSQAFLLPG